MLELKSCLPDGVEGYDGPEEEVTGDRCPAHHVDAGQCFFQVPWVEETSEAGLWRREQLLGE